MQISSDGRREFEIRVAPSHKCSEEMEISVKNHTDVLIFHTAICAGASQISSDGRREFEIRVAPSHECSGIRIRMTVNNCRKG